ncbi:MAG TPA: hypothetical protein VII94_05430, partial [Candidatus Saccharimonadales bacterium]
MDNSYPPNTNDQPNAPITDEAVQQPSPEFQSHDTTETPITSPNPFISHQQETVFNEPSANANPMTPPGVGVNPIAVVRVLSSIGVEYVFLTFALVVASISLGALIISSINGHYDFNVLAYPTA